MALIVLEGIDGAGKDTQAALLARQIPGAETFHYPDRCPIGGAIQVFLRGEVDFPPDTQFLLFVADMLKDRARIEQLRKTRTVILNRFVFSTLAHQGAEGFPVEKGKRMLELLDPPRPDLVISLRVSPEVSLARKQEKDRLETLAHEKRMIPIYDQLAAEAFLGPWLTVNADQPPDRVTAEILHGLRARGLLGATTGSA